MLFLRFRSRRLVFFGLFLTLLFLFDSSNLSASAVRQQTTAGLKKEAIDLYHNGSYDQAIGKFKQIEGKTTDRFILSEVYVYLAMSYYCLEEKEECLKWLEKAVKINPTLDEAEILFPPGFESLFTAAKDEAAKSNQVQAQAPVGERPVIKPSPVSSGKKKKSGLLLIVGGVAAAGVAAAVLLGGGKKSVDTTGGSIQVSSIPTGAKVLLDSNETGRTTNCTLTDVPAGTHTVIVSKDGYVDVSETVSVTTGGTATVQANLDSYAITVSTPTAGAVLLKNVAVNIQWQVPSSLKNSDRAGLSARAGQQGSVRDRLWGQRWTVTRATARSEVPVEGGRMAGPGKNLSGDAVTTDGGSSRSQLRNIMASRSALSGVTTTAGPAPGLQPGTPGDPLSNYQGTPRSGGDIRVLGLTNVRIELWKAGTKNSDIIASASCTPGSTGTYAWSPSTALPDGTDYKIRVVAAGGTSDGNIYGEGPTFAITHWHEFVRKWGSQGSGDGQFNSPTGVAVDSAGSVYVADTNNHRVQKFTPDGVFVAKWGTQGSGDTQFNTLHGLAIASNGDLYVADTNNNRIVLTTSSGGYVYKWDAAGSGDGEFSYPYGMAADSSGYVYVAEAGNNRVQKFRVDGYFSGKWGSAGSGDAQFNNPTGLTVATTGDVYIADQGNQRIQIFTSTGSPVTRWAARGSGDGQFNSPYGIAADRTGAVYVADTGNNRIQRFRNDGFFLAKWGNYGSGDGQFNGPRGIAVDSAGNIYVADTNNHRVQKFRRIG